MSNVSLTIEAKVRATFSPLEVQTVLAVLGEMREPPAKGEWATTRARVQAAILISAQTKLEKVFEGVANSQVDWRDTLVAGGLADGGWPRVAKEAGFDIV